MTADVRPGVVTAVLGAAFLMTVLDSTSVVAALPSIEAALGFEANDAAWVITAYGVAVGGCLLSAGRVADVVGARRTFVVATAAFAVASLICGLASTPPVLVVGRVVQGVAAAAMTPSALALLLAAHPEGPQRNRAIGIWGGLRGIGATAGLLVGGLLTSIAGWQWIFLVNVPVCVLVLVAAGRVLPDPRPAGRREIDIAAAVTLSGALAAGILAVLRGPVTG
ncbi:MFS transporter [Gordonia sp. PKS22-38]|uniref:MFS transporter n=1 Tax=Gordonia prachuapensis TaxID=3115651 RepID=A0ABU7MY97_9ACTN|nr:MFS transporter [Gordonia sp. PKS22-38]